MRPLIKTSALACLFALTCPCLLAGPDESTNAAAPLMPGLADGNIAYLTARLLENYHYSQQPLDAEMSKKFFDGYVAALDPRRENFLQSDMDEFAHFRTNLDAYTDNRNRDADLTPAFQIYGRYLERLREHYTYVQQLLKEDKFKFTGDDRLQIDRRHAPYPKNLDEARQLWREQLRYQYLQDKLGQELTLTNDTLVLNQTNTAGIAERLARHFRWNYHAATNWDSSDVLQAYLEALAHAYDPHSDYFSMAHAQDFSINMSLSLFGIGAQLQEDDGYCTISRLIRGGPAEKSKQVDEKDRIIEVAQAGKPPVDVVDMDLDKVVQLIRGPKGTEVRLTISPANDRAARRVVTLVRDEIKLEDQEAKARLIESPNGRGGTNRVGVIDLPSFYETIPLSGNDHSTPKFASADVAKLIKKLKQEKVDGIILDLRNNPGGSLEEAIKFTGLFITNGPVVQARSPDGKVMVESDTDPTVLYDGPLAVMVNRFSASAAEIAAAALQDYGRAIVVGGSSTHGKGTVQNLNPLRQILGSSLNDPGTIKITIRKFYRVNGASTQLKGVVPDIVLPDVWNYDDDIGESALENALPWDTVGSATYTSLNHVEPYLPALRQSSQARVAASQDFNYIQQDIEQFKKTQADKTVSLNEHSQIKEREDNQARQKARNQERDARKDTGMKIYNITVENADLPGLTPPLGETNDVVAAGSSTNLVAHGGATAKKSPPPSLDPVLNETANILEDYMAALNASHIVLAQ